MTDHLNAARALIVDDEADIRELIDITLTRMAITTVTVATLSEARSALQNTAFDLCLTDMRLPDGDGIELIGEIIHLQPDCPVAVITAHGSTETAVASLKAGAFDFVAKPIDIAVLRRLVERALKLAGRTPTPTPGRTGTAAAIQPVAPRLIGDTRAMHELRNTIARLARSQAPVYITGESGTGKELVARSIHAQGPRADAAFVPVNCGAIPGELMESEFFGYRKGAFTGAASDREGLVQQAAGGTLFLDEIAELPLSMQVKLLRVIQERAARRVGESREEPVDIRVISATHRNLANEVIQGNFREDLFYRLNVIEVFVPPLRERSDDIPALAQRILARLARQLQRYPVPQLADAALEALRQHPFPGNVRELENMLERAVTLSDEPIIEPAFLRLDSPLVNRQDGIAPASAPKSGNGDLESEIEALERNRIQAALEANRYNKTQAARSLGLTFRALRYRMAKLGMQ